MLEGIKQFTCQCGSGKPQQETPYKGDYVKSIKKNVKLWNISPFFPEKSQKIAAFAMLFWFSVTKQSLKNVFGFHKW